MLRDPVETVVSLYNHLVMQRGGGHLQGKTLDDMTKSFMERAHNPTATRLEQLLLSCNGWARCQLHFREYVAAVTAGMHGDMDIRMFTSRIFWPSVLMYDAHYFQPGRALIINSHRHVCVGNMHHAPMSLLPGGPPPWHA